ncbi:MAG TPA: hypothetical protein VHC91_09685 [Trinickia sp.]|uniref:hypothetical protein n=1 Tax=Trinickia sp. TaxID=2571163 RepID=UPI002CA07F73|nr:hypothetical protein [Trinickia sp.]HVW50655.1 hypothetical protein [Trinickia sp.]
MSTPTTKLTVARPTAAPAPTGPAATPAPQIDAGAAEARALSGPLKLLATKGKGATSTKWSRGSFRTSGNAAGAPPEAASSSAAATAAPFVPTGYSVPPGVAGPSMQNPAQMPPPQVRQPPMPMMPPNRPMRSPMFNDGQSPLHHLWNSLVKISESMAGLIQAIARAMANVH